MALLLWTSPALCLRLSGEPFSWGLNLVVSGLFSLLIIGGGLAFVPRRFFGAALSAVLSVLAGMSLLITFFPPALRWAEVLAAGQVIPMLLCGFSDSGGSEEIYQLEYEEGTLVASTSWNSEWKWDVKDGRLIRRRGPREFRMSEYYTGVPPRELPLGTIQEGIPISILADPRPIADAPGPSGRWVVHGRGGRRIYYSNPSIVYWDTRRLEPVITVKAPSNGTPSPDGRWIFIDTSYDIRSRPIPGLRSFRVRLSVRLGSHGRLYDVAQKKIVWEYWFKDGIRGLTFSPEGTYLVAHDTIFESATGKVVGEAPDGELTWLGGDRVLLRSFSGQIELRHMPELGLVAGPLDLPARRWAVSPNGAQAAVAQGNTVRVFSFPDLSPIWELFLVTTGWVIDRAALSGIMFGFVLGLVAFLRFHPRTPPTSPPPTQDSFRTRGRFAIGAFLVLLPLSGLATFMPPTLSNGAAAVSLILVLGSAGLVVWISFSRLWNRILATLLCVLATASGLGIAFFGARECLGLVPEGVTQIIDDRWGYEQGRRRVVDLVTGEEVGRLGLDIPQGTRLRREGGVLRERLGQTNLEWNLDSWKLKRAYILPVDNQTFGGTPFDAGIGEKGRLAPLLTLSEFIRGENVYDSIRMDDGSVVFTMGHGPDERIYRSRLGNRAYLEIPLQAALGALLIVGLLALGKNYCIHHRDQNRAPA